MVPLRVTTYTGLDEAMMRKCLYLARRAAERDDVPIGAVVVRGEAIIGYGYNTREAEGLPTRHAEINAMEMAARHLGVWRLCGCSLYVTKEPCVMCAGALVLARVDRVVYGAADPKYGCCRSVYQLPTDPRFNHRLLVDEGLLAEECSGLLTDFFRSRRKAKPEPVATADDIIE